MSGIELFIDDIDGRTHAAIVRHGRLADLYVDSMDRSATWGSTYIGKVVKVDKRLDAAIVSYSGKGQSGLLAAKHVYVAGQDPAAQRPDIADMISPGQAIVVQIKAEGERASEQESRKMPRLTMKLCVMGQYLQYCPTAARMNAKKTENPKDAALTAHLPGKGWIVTTRAEKVAHADLDLDATGLLKEWQEIKAEAENGDKTPRLIKNGPDALRRVLNDYGSAFIDHLHAGNKKIFDRIPAWCADFNPPLATSKRLRLFKGDTPKEKLFEQYDLYSELEYLQDSRISLSNGGSVIIDEPHAFTAIDVNQGSAPSAAEANHEAAREIARQIWLRNLSGAILVDFIGMSQKSERFQLVETLENLFNDDGAGAQVHGFTRLGIIEMTRKRRTATYAEKMVVLMTKST